MPMQRVCRPPANREFPLGRIYEDRPCPDAPALPRLALFFRSLLHVPLTITPFLQATCPSRCSAGNWLCLAPSCPGGVSRPPGPNWVRFAQSAMLSPPAATGGPNPQSAIKELGSFGAFALRLPSLWPRPSRPAPPGIGFVSRSGASRRCRTFRFQIANHHSYFINHQCRARLGRGLPLPLLRVARIVPKFCARTRPPYRATLCAQRNKEFLARRAFYLFNCCTNVTVRRMGLGPCGPERASREDAEVAKESASEE
jgi:hypothetical protein